MEQFEEIKKEILERAHRSNACVEQYKRAYNSTTIEELCDVIKCNFFWCVNEKVIEIELIEKYKSIFAGNKIYCNVNTVDGFAIATDNATVEAYDNATVVAYDNATVRAYGNATVRAYGNATVEAYDNATVRAYDNATVRAYGNATVEAYDNAYTISYNTIECKLNDNAIYRIISTNEIRYCSDKIKFVKV